MKIYKLENGLFRFGEYILPSGNFYLETADDDESFALYSLAGKRIIGNVYIHQCKKENGTSYASFAELISVIKDFLITYVPDNSGGGGAGTASVKFTSEMVDDFTHLPNANSNNGKFYVTLHDITVGSANKQAGIYLSRNNTWKRVVKFTNIN